MNSSHELLLTALIATFAIFHLVQAQEQEGNPHFDVRFGTLAFLVFVIVLRQKKLIKLTSMKWCS